MEVIAISTRSRMECVDITRQVEDAVARSGMSRGAVVVCSSHTTAGITVNENADPDVVSDLLGALTRLAPADGAYDHGEGNADAHVKTTLVGLSATLPVEEGRLVLGTWQGIYFCEFDGPRRRRVTVQFLPGL